MAVVVEFDGGSRGNPGRAGSGWLVREDDKIVAAGTIFVGDKDTNNVAEYRGCIAGLTAAAERGAARVTLRGDSMLVIRQVKREWQVNAPHLEPLRDQACDIVAKFPMGVEIEHLPAHLNLVADALSNVAMDQGATRTGLELVAEAEQWMKDNPDKVKKGPRGKNKRKRKAPPDAAAPAAAAIAAPAPTPPKKDRIE